eukprot:COSAG02_NODE_13304_length_1412_cov_2.456207_1_plen_200_part_00
MYRADLGGLCTVRKGQVGWGLRHTKGDGFVVVCPLRPLDAPQVPLPQFCLCTHHPHRDSCVTLSECHVCRPNDGAIICTVMVRATDAEYNVVTKSASSVQNANQHSHGFVIQLRVYVIASICTLFMGTLLRLMLARKTPCSSANGKILRKATLTVGTYLHRGRIVAILTLIFESNPAGVACYPRRCTGRTTIKCATETA